MARGKKKEATLTPEERLRAALVPEGEQPYRVPENWCWVYLKSLVQASKEKTENFSDPNITYVGLEHMQKDGGIIGYGSATDVKSLKNVFHPGQLLYGKLRPYLNKHDIATFSGICSTDILVFDTTSLTIPQYINFFFAQQEFIEYASAHSKGINLPRVSETVILDAVSPLPPLPEQHRIVTRIESLFAKLDEAKEKAQAVVDGFETRRAAILHRAFTGELTARWRKKHGVDIESWENRKMSDIALEIKAGGDKPELFSETADEKYQIPVIANGIANEGIIGYTLYPKFEGESITVAGRGTIGVAIYRNYPFFPVVRLIVIIPSKNVCAKFLKYAFDAFPETGVGSSIPQLTAPMVKQKIIPVPSKKEEQEEIVRILDSLLAKEQRAKEAAEAVLERIELIKKAILARAFRGELGTNEPGEESAVEMLRRVLDVV